jgi:hypothetical protein
MRPEAAVQYLLAKLTQAGLPAATLAGHVERIVGSLYSDGAFVGVVAGSQLDQSFRAALQQTAPQAPPQHAGLIAQSPQTVPVHAPIAEMGGPRPAQRLPAFPRPYQGPALTHE